MKVPAYVPYQLFTKYNILYCTTAQTSDIRIFFNTPLRRGVQISVQYSSGRCVSIAIIVPGFYLRLFFTDGFCLHHLCSFVLLIRLAYVRAALAPFLLIILFLVVENARVVNVHFFNFNSIFLIGSWILESVLQEFESIFVAAEDR